MDIEQAIERILLGETMSSIAAAYREDLLVGLGMDPKKCEDSMMRNETERFMSKVSRALGDRCAGDARALAALRAWVARAEDYDAFDALLSNFRFDGREVLIRRGEMLFPGALTSHWSDDWMHG